MEYNLKAIVQTSFLRIKDKMSVALGIMIIAMMKFIQLEIK